MPNNPLYNLTAQKISFTYQNLLQTDGYGNYYNGLGDEIFIGGGTGFIGPTGPQGSQGPTGPTGTGFTGGEEGQILVKNSVLDYDYSFKFFNECIQLQILSEGPSISEGFKGYRYVDRDMEITSARILSNQNSTISFSVKVGGTSIGNINMINNNETIDVGLTGWNKSLSQGNYLEFYVDSPGATGSILPLSVSLTLNANKKI